MDEITGSTKPASDTAFLQQKIDALAAENRLLKENLEFLHAIALTERKTFSGDNARLRLLLEANQHLVLATFGAQDLRNEAQAATRRQTVFLSVLAHELRNPLASIAMANTMLETLHIADERLPKLTAIMRRQVSHLVRLVDDLLDASRISSGKISLQKHPVFLHEIIDSAVETAQPDFTLRFQSIRLDLPPAPVVLRGDLVRLAQLFANLLTNASKFSPPHEQVVVSAKVHGKVLTVSVKDNGSGIAPELQPHIFEMFTQGAESDNHVLGGGLGIGLTLVRSLAEMHMGTVEVSSDGTGQGSEFVVTLPVPVDAMAPAAARAAAD
jgi:signal transduction histidine kinase